MRSPAGQNQGAVDVEVAVTDELPEHADVILANELLDNVPVRIVERTDDGWAEVWIPDQLRPTELALDVDVPVGTRLPVFEEALGRGGVVDVLVLYSVREIIIKRFSPNRNRNS